MSYDVIVVGGGLGGLVSAWHLSKKNFNVLLIEKYQYPKHKVCGEYISNEVLPYINALGFNPFEYGAKRIINFTLSSSLGNSIKTKLPGGGFSISRYCIDSELAKKASKSGVEIVHAKVIDVQFKGELFDVLTKDHKYTAKIVIGSFGKRSNLDIKLERPFTKKSAPFLGVKGHYRGQFPENDVGLHLFKGGYCGLSLVENNYINICYLADYKSFKKYKNLEEFQKSVLCKNKFLKEAIEKSELVFDKPLSISQVSFSMKNPVDEHILMVGDSAGMIHPLAGNGMSMAIRAAQIASIQIIKYREGEISTREELESEYSRLWNSEFSDRLRTGHIISSLFKMGLFSEVLMLILKLFPFLLPLIIKKTSGKKLTSELE